MNDEKQPSNADGPPQGVWAPSGGSAVHAVTGVGATPHSLRARLLWFVLLAIALASFVQAATAYRSALRQADEMFDYHLQQTARSLRGGFTLVPSTGDMEGIQDFDVIVQIWGPDGAQIFRSPRSGLPPQAVLGFSDVTVEGTQYRVYSVQTPLQTIQIAQDMSARLARARALALRAALPVALMAPLLMLAVWWLIARSLAPVNRMRRQIAQRKSDDLSPLPDAGLPAEVQPLVRELNLLFGRVRHSFEAQQNFVADAAHELRTPLTALKLQAQALRRPAAGDDSAHDGAVTRLNEGIDRAIALVSQLLVLARQEAEDGKAAPMRRVNLQDTARAAVADVLPQAQARGIDLGMTTERPAWVQGQPEALHILLRNLLDNAVKYTPGQGRVDLSLQMAGNEVLLAVDDNGPGIPAPERERVFDRFFRGSEQAGRASGSGLGLAIVKAVAERHGATLKLGQSPALGGLRAEVRFIAADPPPA